MANITKQRQVFILSLCIGAGILLVSALVVFFTQETRLEFSLVDAVSGSWVFDATVKIQKRVEKGFKTVDFRFRRLVPGTYDLSIAAPHYEPKTVSVTLFPGMNRIKQPIALIGYEIPDLTGFSVFEKVDESGLALDIRLVRPDGEAVQDHPCIDVILLARIQAQLVDGKPGPADEQTGAERGDILFYGKAPWKWSTELSEVYRYSGFIPLNDIRTGVSPYWIIDYLFLIPDPRKITRPELDALVEKTATIASIDALEKLLTEYRGRIVAFFKTNMNIEGK